MDFMGIGPLEIVLILILGFLFFGPEKLPGMAAKAGRLYRNFTKAANDLNRTLTEEVSIESQSNKDKQALGDQAEISSQSLDQKTLSPNDSVNN